MFFFIPLIPLCVLLIVYKRRGWSLRRSVLIAATIWGVMLVGLTEVLSLFHALAFGPLCAAWLALAVIIAVVAARWPRPARDPEAVSNPDKVGAAAWLLLPGVFIIGGALVTALVCPPNNYDSMTYRMARVAHWVQNGSVEYYPTHILRQLHMPPMAEYAVLHFQIASGGDRFANCVQWLAMLGCLVGVSLIAAEFGAGRAGQVTAAAVCAAIPMGVLQASTTQNDYVLSLWMVCLVCFVLWASRAQGPRRWGYVLGAGAALGLAVLTKGTAYLLAAPFVLWLVVSQLRRHGARGFAPVAAALAIVVAINMGLYCRNTRLYGTPLGGATAGPQQDIAARALRLENARLGPDVLVSNVLRNLATELSPPINNPQGLRRPGAADDALTRATRAILTALGADADDPATTSGESARFSTCGYLWNDENFSASPAHVLLFVAAAAALLFVRMPGRRGLLLYAAAIAGGFLLFCFFIKWQIWVNRLHLPLLVLGCPLTALVLQRVGGRWACAAAAGLLLAGALPLVLWAANRPMLGNSSIFSTPRDELYLLTAGPQQSAAYRSLLKPLPQRRFEKLGLVLGGDNVEYPIWALLHEWPHVEIRHVEVKNVSRTLAGRGPAAGFQPDIIFENVPAADGSCTMQLRQPF